MKTRALQVLMVEDSESDCFLFQVAMENAHVNMALRSVTDGQGAIEYLSGRGAYQDRREYPLPDLVVLDLRMRKVSGTDFLHWCRERPECRHIPVVLLTGAFAEDWEIQAALDAGAARAYLKPVGITGLENIVQDIYELGLKFKEGEGGSQTALANAA